MKRFTETNKWTQDSWFIQLPSKYKLLWLYILDTCDNVGVWEKTFFVAELLLKETYEEGECYEIFKDKIIVFEKKWWIKNFCNFQYGDLILENEKNKPHQSYIKLLKKAGIWDTYYELFLNKDTLNRRNRTNISPTKKKSIIEVDDYTCIYCNKKHNEKDLEIDHIIPENRNGTSESINLVTACKKCNNKKSDYSLEDFCKIENYSLSEIIHRLSERYYRLLNSHKDKDIDKDKGKDKEKDMGLTNKKKQTLI